MNIKFPQVQEENKTEHKKEAYREMRSVPRTRSVFIFSFLILFHVFSVSANTLTATESLTISSNKTIISPSQIFELGFFNPASSSRWYLAIWYKIIPKRAYVWVGNRDNPLSSGNGTLRIFDNNLVIFDQSDTIIWSTNITGGDVRSSVVAELLDNGNFVLRDSRNTDQDGFLWQSFDFPTDTLLPEMKLGWDHKTGFNRILRSWKTTDDPSSGDFSTKFETRGFPEFYVCTRESILYRSGPWNGVRFSCTPGTKPIDYMVFNFTASNEEVTYSYRINKTNVYSILSLSSTGSLQRLSWIEAAQSWKQLWYSPKDLCDNYKECGNYGYCDSNTSPICNCIKGFETMNDQAWALRDDSAGCTRKTRLSCDDRDGFLRLKNMKLPDTAKTIVDRAIGLKECEERCPKGCNCTAYANTDIRNGGSGCVIWTGEILDIRNFASGGQDLYVRLAAADLDDKRIKNEKIIGSSIGVSILLLLSFMIFRFRKRKQKRSIAIHTPIVDQVRSQDSLMNDVVISRKRYKSSEKKTEYLELPMMEFEALAVATNNFSNANKLGQGGFGMVYKGKLLDGKEIAVKRLSKMSSQGTDEFKNEVRLIAKLQHINLVRLLGCCVDKEEKMLIYEYLENLSLDSHLFGFIIFRFWKRKQKQSIAIQIPIVRSQDSLLNEMVISSKRYRASENNTEYLELPMMEFEDLAMATNNFSNANKLGQGGFGIVYKGRLLDGKEIAVKRLSKMSSQGTDEFKNEVRLIAKLQHINLVRLLGCCVDKGEKMLIYEYLENLSLDSHLFDKTRCSSLNWQMRFDIISGIARGLLYLHQDSRFRIIHRDLKASNVLLDKNMTPKISDFGMARIFGREEIEANTRKVVGTYGYMSPEYAMNGIFSMKSDVFSFGVLLLEIISGKKNNGFYNSNRDLNLLGFVWRNWEEGKGLEIVDPINIDSSSSFVLRCIQIGLLCVQECAEDRPLMSSVMVMLGNETTAIPQPKRPGFCVGRCPLEAESSSSTQRECTVNQITLSVIDAR